MISRACEQRKPCAGFWNPPAGCLGSVLNRYSTLLMCERLVYYINLDWPGSFKLFCCTRNNNLKDETDDGELFLHNPRRGPCSLKVAGGE